jgi:hypothetical protein
MQTIKKSGLVKNFNAKLLYIKLSKYLHMSSIIGILYFLLNESIEHTLIYVLFCFVFYILSFIVFYKISSIFIKVNFALFYLGYLLSMPIVFHNSDSYKDTGWKAIGSYNFDYLQTFNALFIVILYISLFVIIGLIFDKILLKPYREKNSYNFNEYFGILSYFSKYRTVFIALLILQFYLSYIMFTYKIGVVGIIPETNIPFKIVGILYYYRFLILPVIIFLLIFSSNKNNNIILFLVVIEALVSGIFSVSRIIVVFHLLPVILFLMYKGRNIVLGWVLLYTVLTIHFVTVTREFVYALDDFHSVNLYNLFDFYKLYDKSTLNNIIDLILSILTRVQGYPEFMLTFFQDLKYIDFNLFLNKQLGLRSLNYGDFNIVSDIFNLKLPDDKAFGVALDPFSYVYLSTKNIIDTILLFFFWVLYLVLTEKILNTVFKVYRNNIVFILMLSFYALLGFYNPSVKTIFFLAPLLLLFAYILIPRKKIHE